MNLTRNFVKVARFRIPLNTRRVGVAVVVVVLIFGGALRRPRCAPRSWIFEHAVKKQSQNGMCYL